MADIAQVQKWAHTTSEQIKKFERALTETDDSPLGQIYRAAIESVLLDLRCDLREFEEDLAMWDRNNATPRLDPTTFETL